MRKALLLAVLLVVIGLVGIALTRGGAGKRPGGAEESVMISGAWALYPMVVRWTDEFKKIHPGVRFDISAGGAGKGATDALVGAADLGMVSRDIAAEEIKRGAWWVTVVKDAVVPVVSTGNPHLARLMANGTSTQALAGVWLNGSVKTWGEVGGDASLEPIDVYTRSDACGAAETWANFLGGKKQDALSGVGVYGDPGVAEAVGRDALGIGYNNIGYAFDAKTGKQSPGIRILPIDFNDNGVLDRDEIFYDTRADLTRAIADGRFPSPPARDLHLLSNGPPKREIVQVFLAWILTDGQKFVAEAGYVKLDDAKLKMGLEKLQSRKAQAGN